MKLLAIESSAKTASVGVVEDGKLLAELSQNNGLTHSKTILPMTDALMRSLGMQISDVDAIAVSNGPGSFTGLRIGVAAAKGLALAADKPCIGVSTLEATAYHAHDGFVCVVMDARAGQVYNACFRMEHGVLTRVTEDAALPLNALEDILAAEERVLLLGDGAHLCYDMFSAHPGLVLPDAAHRFPRAFGVAMAAQNKPQVSPDALGVEYLRLPQAERERLAKLQGGR